MLEKIRAILVIMATTEIMVAPTTMEITAIIVDQVTIAEVLTTAVPIIITDRMVLIINMIPIRMALLAV